MKIKVTKTRNPLAKAFAEPPSLEEEVEFKKLTIVEELLQFMKRHGLKRTELAERMDVPPSRITKMLDGTGNLTIETLVRAGRAVGADLQQTFVSQGQKGQWVGFEPTDLIDRRSAIKVHFPDPRKVQYAPTPTLKTTKPFTRDAEDAA